MTIRPNKRRFAIAFYLLTGCTPWGVRLTPDVQEPRLVEVSAGRWAMCCGHVLRAAELKAWRAAGMVDDGEVTAYGKRSVVAGPAIERWVAYAWDGMAAKRWGQVSR